MIQERIYFGKTDERPYIDTYILDQIGDCDKCRGAVIILPGGAYSMTSEREGEPVAMKFAAAGYHAFVLSYRVLPKKYTEPLEDLARAVSLLRAKAKEWRIDPDDITICGFSAGGHLAAMLGVFWDKSFLSELTETDSCYFRPNRIVLGYPVITSGKYGHEGSFITLSHGDESQRDLLSLEKQVNENTPPTFLWHTADDAIVPVENSLMFAAALSNYKIPFEMHIFPLGCHGQSVAEDYVFKSDPDKCSYDCAEWIPLALKWMKNN